MSESTSARSPTCRHPDIRKFDGFRSCLACGTTIFESPSADISGTSPDSSSPTESATYQYRRLNYELGQEIRLLIVEPGATQDPIRCSLVTVNLLDNPEYEALSYTWATENGDDSLSQEIQCGLDTTLQVTKNCEAAIRRLRKVGLRRTLWIDALCIDQRNDPEKNHQVALMGRIYSGAARVLVYIDCNGSVFKTLFHWLRRYDISGREIESLEDLLLRRMLQKQILELFSLRWFSRVWVIQEVALSRAAQLLTPIDEVVLDGETIARLETLYRYLERHDLVEGKKFPGALLWRPGRKDLERPDLLTCLLTTRNCFASDLRDKVFSVLNLVGEEVRSLVTVDYSSSIDKVYANAAAAVIAERSDLSILLYAHGKQEERAGWPFWVPDWRHLGSSSLPQFTSSSKGAWVAKSSEISVLEDPYTLGAQIFQVSKPCLRVRAHILDSIDFENWTTWMRAKVYAKNWDSYWQEAARRSRKELTQFFFKEKDTNEGYTMAEFAFTSKFGLAFYRLHDRRLGSPLIAMREVFGLTEPYEEFLETARRTDDRCYLFRTKYSLGFARYGYHESGTHAWQNGDVVAALDGARTPFILHHISGNKYRIACECYLMGALGYDTWKRKGGRGPWGELPDPVPEDQRSLMIDIY